MRNCKKATPGFRKKFKPLSVFTAARLLSLNLLILSFYYSPTHAATISMSTTDTTVNVGDTFVVDFYISDLTSNAGDSLSAFDLDVLFDNTTLAYTGTNFTHTAGDNQLEFTEVGSLPFDGAAFDLGAGLVDVYGISGNSDTVIDANQLDEFRFLGLEFTAIATTSFTSISIDLVDPALLLLDSGFNNLSKSFSSSQVNMTISSLPQFPVSEPGTLALFAALIPVLSISQKKYRNKLWRN